VFLDQLAEKLGTDSSSSLDCANHRDVLLRVRNHSGVYECLHLFGRGIPSIRGVCALRQFIRTKLIRGGISAIWRSDVRDTELPLGDNAARLLDTSTRTVSVRVLGLWQATSAKK
jgi:hypothetical protein